MKSTIAQRLSKLGVGLESAEVMPVPAEEPVVDTTSTEVVDTLALTDAQAEVDEAEGVLDRLQEDHAELSEVAGALESFLASSEPISPMIAAALAIPARRATQAYGLTSSIPSVESFGTSQEAIRANLVASLEATESRLEQFTKWLKEVFTALIEKMGELWAQFTDRFGHLKKKAEALLESLASSGDAENSGTVSIPPAIVKHLVVDGQLPKDFRQPMARLTALVDAQMQEISGDLYDASVENLHDAEELIREISPSIGVGMQQKVEAYMERVKARIAGSFEKTDRADKEVWEPLQGSFRRTQPLMGNERIILSPGIFKLTGSIQVDGDFPAEPIEVDGSSLRDQAEELLKSVISICDIVAKFNATMPKRKELYSKTEKLAFSTALKAHKSLFQEQFIREFSLGMLGAIQSAKAVEGPVLNHTFRACNAVVAVCGLGIKA